MRRLIATTLLVTMTAVACGSASSTIGPLSITPPDGWLVTDREEDSIKVTNGTIGDENATQAGTATAVFDVYVESSQSLDEFRDVLDENNVDPKEDRLTVGGYDATAVSYESNAFSPSMEVVFVPDWQVRIVYRAAFGDGDSAFARYRSDFRKALRSIRFSGRPSRGA